MSLDAAPKTGPGSIELPRSPSPLAKANALLFAHFERPGLSSRLRAGSRRQDRERPILPGQRA